MLSHRLYYFLKPYLPWSFRITLRRIAARRRRRRTQAVWPIDPGAAKAPRGWSGWPNKKQFAVILTHDVEGPTGLLRCEQLAKLETKFGLRSSFNFIPEGSYRVSADLRRSLTHAGFEVGVHDLRHDGSLYVSREAFRQQAQRINEHLAAWNAVGFRSGFMYHNTEWLHDLAIEYDASTFDTDPFEPQPDGARTIFPFWVASPDPAGTADGKAGYAELPYTLPQDSTMFLVMQERGIDLWKTKLDWVAQQGGMVLLNVHPDYLEHSSGDATVLTRYEQLLTYLTVEYRGAFWHALPREAAALVRPACPASSARFNS